MSADQTAAVEQRLLQLTNGDDVVWRRYPEGLGRWCQVGPYRIDVQPGSDRATTAVAYHADGEQLTRHLLVSRALWEAVAAQLDRLDDQAPQLLLQALTAHGKF